MNTTGSLWNLKATKRFSLLSSKSLNNLQSDPAELVALQKAARRAQRVVPGPAGASTIISPNGNDAGPLVSFDHAATMFIESNRNSIVEPMSNARNSRLLSIDFGFERRSPTPEPGMISRKNSCYAERTPTISSPSSTPLTLSDAYSHYSDTSSLQGLMGFASEFPQPPSLSPALRRMQSAPWLKKDEYEFPASATAPGGPCDSKPMREGPYGPVYSDGTPTQRSDDTSSYTSSALSQTARPRGTTFSSNPIPRAESRMGGANGGADQRASWAMRSNRKTWTTDDLLQWSLSQRTHPSASSEPAQDRRVSTHLENRRYTLCIEPDEAVIVEKPRFVRKVASMQGRSKDLPPPSSTDKSSQRPIQKISSNQGDSREGKQRSWLASFSRIKGAATAIRFGFPGWGLDFYSTAAAIAPIMDGGIDGTAALKQEEEGRDDGIDSASHGKKRNSHLKDRERSTRRAAAKSHGNLPDTLDASESFINISVNDRAALRNAGSRASVGAGIGLGHTSSGASGRVSVSAEKPGLERRKRVQTLLARASVGFLEWGKSLAGRRHQSP
ncbi:hypothetical protein BKA70DRAFT_1273056 [Coprinopsis sp. MPI-PUGE-AT-0042]|nr:hypothetical protein BKA70DRAFT_1273056 [Coprinopsis sp. MPI-PUGE-AT-0042]